MTRIGKIALSAAVGSCAAVSIATATPVSINSPNFSYNQNFDSLAAQGTAAATANAWANSSTINGWVAFQALPGGSASTGFRDTPNTAGYNAITNYRADNGSGNAGALYSFGSASASDRALGSTSSGTPGDLFFGVEFTNDSGVTIDNITISYRGEQWRNGGNTAAQKLGFDYSRTASSYSDNANFLAFSALDFNSPVTGATAAALDGNAVPNFTNISGVLTGVGLLPGETLRLRWWDDNDQGNDHALAIDDVSFQTGSVVTPEPASLGLLALLSAGLTRRRK